MFLVKLAAHFIWCAKTCFPISWKYYRTRNYELAICRVILNVNVLFLLRLLMMLRPQSHRPSINVYSTTGLRVVASWWDQVKLERKLLWLLADCHNHPKFGRCRLGLKKPIYSQLPLSYLLQWVAIFWRWEPPRRSLGLPEWGFSNRFHSYWKQLPAMTQQLVGM